MGTRIPRAPSVSDMMVLASHSSSSRVVVNGEKTVLLPVQETMYPSIEKSVGGLGNLDDFDKAMTMIEMLPEHRLKGGAEKMSNGQKIKFIVNFLGCFCNPCVYCCGPFCCYTGFPCKSCCDKDADGNQKHCCIICPECCKCCPDA